MPRGRKKSDPSLSSDRNGLKALRHVFKQEAVIILKQIDRRHADIDEIFKITRLAANLVLVQEAQNLRCRLIHFHHGLVTRRERDTRTYLPALRRQRDKIMLKAIGLTKTCQ